MKKSDLLLEIADAIKDAYREQIMDGNVQAFVSTLGEVRKGLLAEGFTSEEIMQIISLILTLSFTTGGKN